MTHSHKRVNAIALVFLLLTGTAVQAQQSTGPPEEPKTKLESFQRQTGTVVIKGYSEFGTIQGLGTVSVDCIEFTDATTRQRVLGVGIDVVEGGKYEHSDRSFIDYDEIESLLKGIDYISSVKADVTKLEHFEAIYKTKGNFTAGTFSRKGKVDAVVKSGYIRPATAYLSLQQLGEVRELISKAKQKLDSLK